MVIDRTIMEEKVLSEEEYRLVMKNYLLLIATPGSDFSEIEKLKSQIDAYEGKENEE